MTEKTINPIEFLKGKKDEDLVYVENMLNGDSVFRGRDDNKYEMAPHGYAGSIVSIPAKVLRGHTYLLRKIGEGKILLHDEQSASTRQDELKYEDTGEFSGSPLKYLEEGASEANHFTKEGLSDEGEQQGSISAREVWSNQRTEPKTVRRSGDDTSTNEAVELPKVVVTETVKEGEWTPDTGV